MNEFYYNSISIGSELRIAGNFIFDACQSIYSLMSTRHAVDPEVELFHSLYNLSVGFERMLKVIIVLDNDIKSSDDLAKLEKNNRHMRDHNHAELNKAIKEHVPGRIIITKEENKLIALLCKFYNKNRYGHFCFDSDADSTRNMVYETTDVKSENIFDEKPCLDRALNIIMKPLNSLSKKYMGLIGDLVSKKSIYTTEVSSDSKYAVVSFYRGDILKYFRLRDITYYELMYFVACKYGGDYEMTPVSFDDALINEHLDSYIYDRVALSAIDECESEYINLVEGGRFLPNQSDIYSEKKTYEDADEMYKDAWEIRKPFIYYSVFEVGDDEHEVS